MSDTREAASLLALLTHDQGSWVTVTKDLLAFGSVAAAIEQRSDLQPDLFSDVNPLEEPTSGWARQLDLMWEHGVACLPLTSSDYPAALKSLRSPPPFIFIHGTLDPRDHAGVAVIGSRKVPPSSLATAYRWARELAEAGTSIVSGLAAGIDAQAHRGALDADGRTVAVIGTGIQRTYPAENKGLQQTIASRGLVVSQFLPDTPPTKTSFPMRNALMAAWAHATLVIDAGDRSGAALQARLATEQGKTLLLHSGLQAEDWARDFATRELAHFVATPEEVLASLEHHA